MRNRDKKIRGGKWAPRIPWRMDADQLREWMSMRRLERLRAASKDKRNMKP